MRKLSSHPEWQAREKELAPRDALHLLEGDGCAVCRFVARAERNFYFWFVNENYQDADVSAAVASALGFCPPHTRRLLSAASPGVAGHVYSSVVPGVLAALQTNGSDGSCLACDQASWAGSYATDVLFRGFHDPAAAGRFVERGGLCVPHFVRALSPFRAAAFAALADALEIRLNDGAFGSVEAFAGSDPDAAARRFLSEHDRATEDPAAMGDPVRWLRASLRKGVCIACRAAGSMERRYVRWIAFESRTDSFSFEEDASGTCPAHLHDLAQVDRNALARVVRIKATRFLATVRLARERLDASLTGFAARWRRRSRRDAVLAPVSRPSVCGACEAAGTAAARTTALLLAALADSGERARYEVSHGLCARHVLTLPTGPRRELAADVLRARLGVLAWALEEASRKRSWAVRYEPAGPESSAWLRAPAQIDGRVFLGLPAMLLPQAPLI